MFVVKNAWKSVMRNKGRNILVIIIVTIIAIAATIGLSIRQAATTARNTGLENTTVTAQISLDREKLISESRNQSNSSESDASDQSGEGRPNVGGMGGGKDFGGTSMVSGDFSLVGFSSDEAVSIHRTVASPWLTAKCSATINPVTATQLFPSHSPISMPSP